MLEIPASADADKSLPDGESPALGLDDEPPIDLVHLARQCQGDPELEAELLGLFRHQALTLAAQLSAPPKSLESQANIAHKLLGSALAVGAGRVARAAAAIQDKARARPAEPPQAMSQAIVALEGAVAEAVAEIERLRA